MSLFDQPLPPEVDPQEEEFLKRDRWVVVALCVSVAFGYSYFRNIKAVPDLIFAFARVVGGAFALLILPTILSFIAAQSTDKWHRVFVVTFVVLLVLVVTGDVFSRGR